MLRHAIQRILNPSDEIKARRILKKYGLTVFDPSPTTCYSDSAGTTPAVQDGVIGRINCGNGSGFYATQSTTGFMPKLRKGAVNLLTNSATLSTRNVTTSAIVYTLQFKGTGTVTLSGTSTAGPLAGTGAGNLVSLTFTPTAGTLTLTVAGSVTSAMLNIGTTAEPYVATTTVPLSNGVGPWWMDFDGVDDFMTLNAVPFQMSDNNFMLACAASLNVSGNYGVFCPGSNGGWGRLGAIMVSVALAKIQYISDSGAAEEISGGSVTAGSKFLISSKKIGNGLTLHTNSAKATGSISGTGTYTQTNAYIGKGATAGDNILGAIYSLIFGRANEILGPELVTNGDFSNGTTGWGNASSGTGSATVSGGQLSIYRLDGSNKGNFNQSIAGVVVGKVYKVSFTIISGTGFVSFSSGGGNFSATGNYYITASSSVIHLETPIDGSTVVLDNISVKEVLPPPFISESELKTLEKVYAKKAGLRI